MPQSAPIPWKHFYQTLRRFAPFWLGVTLLFTGLGIAYAMFSSDQWEASQPLLVRDEANGSVERLGKFASQTELLAAQETLLEMARNPEVVEAALKRLPPPADFQEAVWPTADVIDATANEAVNLRAPKTSEFGKTEVVYLTARDASPERASELCGALFAALTDHLRNVRRLRADSIVNELKQARNLAKDNLEQATGQLKTLEQSLGIDLGELRLLSESMNSESNSSRVITELQRDLRLAEQERDKLQSLQALLMRAYEDPTQLVVSDGELLTTQPTLQRLTAGLIDAQIEASRLAGSLKQAHPRMVSARLTTETIREELRREIVNVTETMKPSLRLAAEKCERLIARQTDLQAKLNKLATIRADYSLLVKEVEHRTGLLSDAETALAEAEASLSAAMTVNLLSELGPVRAGENPVGIGGTMVTAGATMAGLMLGLGGVFLVAPTPGGGNRRWSDRLTGRRATDSPESASSQPPVMPPFPDRRAAARVPAANITTTLQPVNNEPTASQPNATQPTASQPTATQPTAIQPTATQPTATQPTATQPTATQPTATQPTATQPTATQPTATQPTATQPTANTETIAETAVLQSPRAFQQAARGTVTAANVATANSAAAAPRRAATENSRSTETLSPIAVGTNLASPNSATPKSHPTSKAEPPRSSSHPAGGDAKAKPSGNSSTHAKSNCNNYDAAIEDSLGRTEMIENLMKASINLDHPLPFEDVQPEPLGGSPER
ncbi:hypothetical protein SH139x_003998 [Planctomycetaceae bacterium SH139]